MLNKSEIYNLQNMTISYSLVIEAVDAIYRYDFGSLLNVNFLIKNKYYV